MERYIILLILVIFLFSCEENEPIGNNKLEISQIVEDQALLGDTITIIGNSFNPLTHQNQVYLTTLNVGDTTFTEDPIPVVNVSNDRTEIRVLVPTIQGAGIRLIDGPIRMIYGVDTITSDDIIRIIPIVRPAPPEVFPKAAAPGTIVNINLANSKVNSSDQEIQVFFGTRKANLVPSQSSLEINAIVPNLFGGSPGRTTLQIGVVDENDLVYRSSPITFVLLSVPQNVPSIVWTQGYQTESARVFQGIVGDSISVQQISSSFVGGGINGYPTARGIIMNKNGEILWAQSLNGGFGNGTAIFKKLFNSEQEAELIYSNRELEIFDLVIGNDDVVYGIDFNGRIGYMDLSTDNGPERIFESLNLISQLDNHIDSLINLKLAGQRLYWCNHHVVMSGNVNGQTNTVDIAYDISDIASLVGPLLSNHQISAIALNGQIGQLYIAFKNGPEVYILRGDLFGNNDLDIFYSSEEFFIGSFISDMEVNQGYLYWIDRDIQVGSIHRVAISGNNGNIAPETIINDLNRGSYFDIPGQ